MYNPNNLMNIEDFAKLTESFKPVRFEIVDIPDCRPARKRFKIYGFREGGTTGLLWDERPTLGSAQKRVSALESHFGIVSHGATGKKKAAPSFVMRKVVSHSTDRAFNTACLTLECGHHAHRADNIRLIEKARCYACGVEAQIGRKITEDEERYYNFTYGPCKNDGTPAPEMISSLCKKTD